MTIKQTTWTVSSTDKKQHGKKENIFSFTCNSNYQIKEKDLIDLFITVGQGITYWGEAYINFRPNKAYEKGFLKIEREGGIYINTNKLKLDSEIFCIDKGDDSDIEIIDTKTVKDFINTIKLIIESPNSNSEIKFIRQFSDQIRYLKKKKFIKDEEGYLVPDRNYIEEMSIDLFGTTMEDLYKFSFHSLAKFLEISESAFDHQDEIILRTKRYFGSLENDVI